METKNRKKVLIIGAAVTCITLVTGISVYQFTHKKTTSSNKTKTISAAKDYEEVYNYIKDYQKEQNIQAKRNDRIMYANGSMQENTAAGCNSYSKTNTRQQGVDEADTAKTDGTYLYALSAHGNKISIVTTGESMQEVGNISTEDEEHIKEFYLFPDDKKVVLIITKDAAATKALTYDVSNVSDPKLLGTVEQSGYYSSSRYAEGYLYLFSNEMVSAPLEKKKPETYVPLIQGKTIDAGDIVMPMLPQGNMYEIVTSIDITNPGEIVDSKAIFSKGGSLYVSNENIYYYESEWNTSIRRIAYKNGELIPKAQGEIDGYINDSFSIDEYEGNLRVVTTTGDSNSVYVLNEELKTIGKIEGLAKDERVYSARFFGETGYFVTFKAIDPLFTVDFSKPEKPEIIGQLKIPGFSDYLHFYGENRLLGIGMDVDEKTQVAGGVKLSMFDISDKENVKEENTHIIDNLFSTDVTYDYQAVLIDEDKNLIGFSGYDKTSPKYYVFSYDKTQGFQCHMEESISGNTSQTPRGIYVGDILYVVQGNVIESYSLETYTKVDDIVL